MFPRLANFVTRYWILVLLAWVAATIGLKMVAPKWDDITHDGDFAYLPARMTSNRGEALLARAFPKLVAKSDIVIVIARPTGRLSDDDFAVADRLADMFEPKNDPTSPVASVMNYGDPVVGKKLVSPITEHGQAVLVILQLKNEFMAISNIRFINHNPTPALPRPGVYQKVEEFRRSPSLPTGLELGVTGSASIGTDLLMAQGESIHNTEKTTIALVAIILLLVYWSPGLLIVPLATIAVSYLVSVDLVALVSVLGERTHWFSFEIFKASNIFIVVVLFGAATDYCLFLIARYREELESGLEPGPAIRAALAQTGHALTASAMTTILGLGAMMFADFGKYRSGGPTIALSLVVALLAALTVAPALLYAGGRWVFWPFGLRSKDKQRGHATPVSAGGSQPPPGILGRMWTRIANAIVTYPGTILAVSFLVLAVPAYQGLSIPITYDILSELDAQRTSVRGIHLLQQYFPIGDTGPITVLAHQEGVPFDDPEHQVQIHDLTAQLKNFLYTDSHGVATNPVLAVRSLTNPLGDPHWPDRLSSKQIAIKRRAAVIYLSAAPGYEGNVTRFDIVAKYDPFSRESILLFNAIEKYLLTLKYDRSSPWHGVDFDFIGITPGIRDLDMVNVSDIRLISVLVSLAVLGVLVFLLRRPMVSLYLVFTVLFGYYVTMGLTKLFFAYLYGDTFQGLDWKLPIFLFVILVAVGEDYNIYLVTRVFEEQRRRGLIEGLREAVIRTGGIITSCGVIMAGTFGSMISGTLRSMFETGFALALGVLLDTFIIRTILVPSFLTIWGRWFGKEPVIAAADAVRTPHYESTEPPREREIATPADRRAG